MRIHVVLLGLFATSTVAVAAPQLDLPKERKSPPKESSAPPKTNSGDAARRGDIAGGSVTDAEERRALVDREGRTVGIETTRRMNVPGSTRGSGRGSLQLPSGGRRAPAAGGAAEPSRGEVAPATPDPFIGEPSALVPAEFPSSRNSARFLYELLLRAERPSDTEVGEAADRLARLGEDGLEVARYALRADDEVLVYAGSRALLQGGTADDADDVVLRLRGALPGNVAPLILEELVERDPVRGNEALLADLLRHDSGALRRTAKRLLEPRLDASEAGLLAPALKDEATEVRRAAVELLTDIDGPVPPELIIDHVTDRSSSVAQLAIRALRYVEDEEVDRELLRRAMEGGEILRREAMLLVAIAEREDRLTRPILGPQHAPPLVDALQSPLPIVQSAAAIALSGVGFRAPRSEGTQWMDDSVPSTLVGVAAGFTFFDGLEVVRDPALRRLRQISGVSHGNNGPAWARWWARSKAGFRASRAVIEVPLESEERVLVAVQDPQNGARFALAGPALARDESWLEADPATGRGYGALKSRGDVFFMAPADSAELVTLLRDEGVFGVDRLPGPRGLLDDRTRSLEVRVDDGEKEFRFSSRRAEPWFDRILTRADGLAERSAWQRYPVAGEHADALALYATESEWWNAPHSVDERVARFEAQLLRHLDAALPTEREAGLEELARLAQRHPGVLGADDIAPLLDLLVQEPRFNDRSKSLVALLRTAAADGTAELSRESAAGIVATLHDRFGASSLPAIRDLLIGQGRDAVLAGIVDDRGLVRVAAAQALGEGDQPQDIDLLMALLEDPDTDVETAAVRSLGERRAARAQEAILLRAVAGTPSVRVAALRALGSVGGPDAVDALVAGLTDPEERYHLPAAEGLSRIGTEEAAPLLVSVLRRSRTRPAVRNEAIRGLEELGPLAHAELYAAMRSPDAGLRRDAALILSGQLEPRAVPTLAQALVDDPADEVAGRELVVLTCVDFREEPLPAEAWFRWWDEVDRRDPFSWFIAALERRNIRAPARDDFLPPATEDARVFLLTLIVNVSDPLLAERALRELEALHGDFLGPIPTDPDERSEWFAATQSVVLANVPTDGLGR
ncbi:MAG: HEAT repeat domain-containing protein [Planctomycetota bacterium]